MPNWIPDEAREKLNLQLFPLVDGSIKNISDQERGRRIKVLVGYGADINAKSPLLGKTPLMICASASREIASDEKPTLLHTLLTIPGININAQDDGGNTALHLVMSAHPKFRGPQFKALLDAGADTTITNQYGDTALHEAAAYCHASIVHHLIKGGCDIHKKNHDNKSPVQQCIYSVKESIQAEGNHQAAYKSVQSHLPALELFAKEIDDRYHTYKQHPGSEFMLGLEELKELVAKPKELFTKEGLHKFENQMGLLNDLADHISKNPGYPTQHFQDETGRKIKIPERDIERPEASRRVGRLYLEEEAKYRVLARKPLLEELPMQTKAQKIKQQQSDNNQGRSI